MSSDFFQKRREKLANSMENNSICVIESATEKLRSNDVPYPYRQDSNFFYLTNFDSPNAVLVIYRSQKGKYDEFFFTKRPNSHDETWTGKVPSKEQVKSRFNFKHCVYLDEIPVYLEKYLIKCESIYHSLEDSSNLKILVKTISSQIKKKYRKGITPPSSTICLHSKINKLRLIKDSLEIRQIKTSANISSMAHNALMRKCQASLTEKQLQYFLIDFFNQHNAVEAYPSIVASGENSCILHYTKNSSALKSGQLLLTDAACEKDNYTSDITRTIPINGKFTEPQKKIYNIVLKAQMKAIEKCKANNTLVDVHNEAVKWISKGLLSLGLLKGPLTKIIKNGLYQQFYMHGTGHWLGLDVHDPLDYQEDDSPIKLRPGMVFTVEPGIYIRPSKQIPKSFHNIGIRIEDDVLITKKGCAVLTHKTPKSVAEIENMMKS